MQFVILACAALGILCLWIAARQRTAIGLPAGRLFSVDDLGPGRRGSVLYDPDLDISGRPDYVIEHEGEIVPVEVKSRRAPDEPYPSHALQLAAYCRLVEATYGRRPTHGVLKYRDHSFSVAYTADLEHELRVVVGRMRQSLSREPDRSHRSKRRCTNCGFRPVCDQALG